MREWNRICTSSTHLIKEKEEEAGIYTLTWTQCYQMWQQSQVLKRVNQITTTEFELHLKKDKEIKEFGCLTLFIIWIYQ